MNEFSTVMDDMTELSETDFDVLLIYLSRDSNSIVYDGKVSYEYPCAESSIIWYANTAVLRPSSSSPAMTRRHR